MYTIRGIIGHLLINLFGVFPLQNKIIFSCFDGNSFGDSPKAIFDELVYTKSKAKLIWFMNDDSAKIEEAEVVRPYSIKALYHQATAKVWVFNSRQREWMIKRKEQLYIQTWHGGLGIKKIEKDAIDKLPKSYIDAAKNDSNMADLFLSNSKWLTNLYKKSFWYEGKILEVGLPKSDIFYKNKNEIVRRKVLKSFNLEEDVKLALYAPTFRDDDSTKCYNLNYKKLIETLEIKWPSKWKLLTRFHPNVKKKYVGSVSYNNTIINGSEFDDINELIIASDILITDYSSCMFDALEIKKKVFIYASDYQEYLDERGTYFRLTDLPFPVATNNDELFYKIKTYDENKYSEKGELFLKECGLFNKGTASKDIVGLISKVFSDNVQRG